LEVTKGLSSSKRLASEHLWESSVPVLKAGLGRGI
jgi:hypothetical protein